MREIVKSRRKQPYILQIRILLTCSIYGGTEGLYRRYKELPHASSLAEILPEVFIQRRSSGSLHALYYDQSSTLLSGHFGLFMRILYSILVGYTRSSSVIDND